MICQIAFAVEALMAIKEALNDPHAVLSNWDDYSVDPCSWTMITCSSDYLVTALLVSSSSSKFFHIPYHSNLISPFWMCAGEHRVNLCLELCPLQLEISQTFDKCEHLLLYVFSVFCVLCGMVCWLCSMFVQIAGWVQVAAEQQYLRQNPTGTWKPSQASDPRSLQ